MRSPDDNTKAGTTPSRAFIKAMELACLLHERKYRENIIGDIVEKYNCKVEKGTSKANRWLCIQIALLFSAGLFGRGLALLEAMALLERIVNIIIKS